MKFHNLRDFVTVGRMGGIRAAARELNLTQPALSRSIRQLEDELGVPLFERTSKGAALNAFGQAFLARAEAATQELARGREELLQMRGDMGGTVSVAVSSVASLMFLPAVLAAFRKQFSQAQIRIIDGTYPIIQRGLRDGSLDFAVGPLPPQPVGEDFVVEELFANHRCVVGRIDHPLGGARRLKDLGSADWVITGAIGPRGEEFREIFIRYGLPVPSTAIRCESLIALLALLSGTDSLTFLPRQWVESPLMKPLLSRIDIAETVPGPSTCLVRRDGLPLTPVADALANAFRREAAYYMPSLSLK